MVEPWHENRVMLSHVLFRLKLEALRSKCIESISNPLSILTQNPRTYDWLASSDMSQLRQSTNKEIRPDKA